MARVLAACACMMAVCATAAAALVEFAATNAHTAL